MSDRSHEVRIGVIGTAGRRDDADRLDGAMYDAMYGQVVEAVDGWKATSAVSGGAAYADHLAVRAYLDGRVDDLLLFLPAAWSSGRFVPDPRVTFNPGRTMNSYHKAFSDKVGIDSLSEIGRALDKGARAVVENGFHNRNTHVARAATHMLALTYGGGSKPPMDLSPGDDGFLDPRSAGLKDGGTADCWSKADRCVLKRHVSLKWLEARERPGPSRAVQGRLF